MTGSRDTCRRPGATGTASIRRRLPSWRRGAWRSYWGKYPDTWGRCRSNKPAGVRPWAFGGNGMSRAATEWRYEKLTWPEINDAVELGKVCIVPCGAVEQHGPHLPLD